MKHLLAMRFSAFGDVAMTVPVIREFLEQNPGVRITFVSAAPLAPLFDGIARLDFFPAHPHDRHRGIPGLVRLYRELLAAGPFDAVLDLHSVLRTHFLRTLFRLKGLPVYQMNKARYLRRALNRRHDKIKQPLRTVPERYGDVLRRSGFPLTLSHTLRKTTRPLSEDILTAIGHPPAGTWIGIAPFSTYPGKIYPPEKMFEAVQALAKEENTAVILFGGRGNEAAELEKWQKELPGTFVAAGKLSLSQELDLISHLQVMLSMDSANMHLASLVGTRAVSVWGATHPYSGFLGYGQSPEDTVSLDLDCRPCSTFGKAPCYKGTYECLASLPANMLVEAVKKACHGDRPA